MSRPAHYSAAAKLLLRCCCQIFISTLSTIGTPKAQGIATCRAAHVHGTYRTAAMLSWGAGAVLGLLPWHVTWQQPQHSSCSPRQHCGHVIHGPPDKWHTLRARLPSGVTRGSRVTACTLQCCSKPPAEVLLACKIATAAGIACTDYSSHGLALVPVCTSTLTQCLLPTQPRGSVVLGSPDKWQTLEPGSPLVLPRGWSCQGLHSAVQQLLLPPPPPSPSTAHSPCCRQVPC